MTTLLSLLQHNAVMSYPFFIYDEQVAGEWGFGGASQWWLHES